MSLKKRVDSFRFAIQGLKELFRTQANAQIHLAATVLVVGAGLYFGISRLEWVAVVLCIALVIGSEALNTAVENLTDLVSPEHHPLAGKAKDVAAAAVLLAAIAAILVAALIFFPRLFA